MPAEPASSSDNLQGSEQFRLLVQAVTDYAIYTLDSDGHVANWNAGAQRTKGYTADEIVGRHFSVFFAEEDRARHLPARALHEASLTGRYETEGWRCRKDGSRFWALVVINAMYDPAGRTTGYAKITRDITARRQQENALRKSEDFLSRTGAIAGVGGWELDIATGDVTWSAETCRIQGVAPGHQPSLDEAIAFYAPEARPIIRAAVQDAMSANRGWDLELPVIRADGCSIWVRTVGCVVFENGKAIRLSGAIQDVSVRVAERLALKQAHETVALATRSGGIGIWDWDFARDRLVWDAWMRHLYGVDPADEREPARLWMHHLHPADAAAAEHAIQDAITGKKPFDTEFRVVWSDGSVHHLRASGSVVSDEGGQPLRMVGTAWDVTGLRQLAAALSEQHKLLRVTLQSIGDGVVTTDAQGMITWLNPSATQMTGWSEEEALGRPLQQVVHIVNEQTRTRAECPVARCLAEGFICGLPDHTLLISKDGAEFAIEDSAAPIRNGDGETLGVVFVFHDVSVQRRLSGEMNYRASHDTLTGLFNRSEFEIRLQEVLQASHAAQTQNALLYIDLDQFKLVNDACGHTAGDHLLRQVARVLSDAVRDSDMVARLGGDEFAIILARCPPEDAMRLAQRICDRMDEFRFVHDGKSFRIGTSIGLVEVDGRWSGMAAILQAADSSCYAAKEAGRNRVHAWFDTDQTMHARRDEMQWATRLELALDEDRFVLFAQRIEDLRGSDGMHAEVLLRMLEHDGSLTQPGVFLPSAERFHLASRIDRWVLRRVIGWMLALPSCAEIATISVNLSGQSVGDRAFHRMALEMLSDAGPLICAKLCLEITETSAITNLADAALFIEQVRALGVRIALDDFGAGASSFGYLKALKVDFLKIDGQFIRTLVTDPLNAAAVRCFVDVAGIAGMKTVAEFVDDPGVLTLLRSMGIDYAQGFLMHRPDRIDVLLGSLLPGVGQSGIAPSQITQSDITKSGTAAIACAQMGSAHKAAAPVYH